MFWEARAVIHGRRVSFYDDAKSAAQAKARQARSDAERGAGVGVGAITVEAYLDAWLERVRPTVRARTHASYAQHVRHHIVPAIGRVRLVQLAPGHITAMLAKIIAAGGSEGTARRVRAVLSAALHAAQLDHGLPRNAASLAKLPKSDRPAFTPETITPDQARAILTAVSGSRIEPLVMFSIATGVRQGELLALRWRDVDLDERSVTITHAVDVQGGRRVLARPKTVTSQRALRLPDLAVRALELRREQEAGDRLLAGSTWHDLDLVFPNPTGGIRDGTAVTRRFQDRLAAAGLPRIRWHALRRVFAAVLQDGGVPLERVRDLLGHSEIRVTEHYAYVLPESLARDMGVIDTMFPREVGYEWGTGGGESGPDRPEVA